MDFQHRITPGPDNKTEIIIELLPSGKIYSSTIKNREYPDEQTSLINGTMYKLVYKAYLEAMSNVVNTQVKEKLEQKNIEIVSIHHGRPKSMNSKHNLTEERKQYMKEKKHYVLITKESRLQLHKKRFLS